MKFHLVLIVLLLTACNVQAVFINEIMPNPDDYRDQSEWIEIHNPGNLELNLSVWNIGDGDSNDSLFSETSMITNSTYFLIIGENANISNITENNVIYFRTDGKIGSGLNNDEGDNVTIYNSTGIVDYVSYLQFPDSKEGYSWARMDNGSWVYSESPTPGEPNFLTNTSENETEENQTIMNNMCDLYLWIKCDETFSKGSNKYWLMVKDLEGGDYEPEVEYWIEDMFGNIIRPKEQTNKTNDDKSWPFPRITGTEAYVIYAMITNEVCNDSDNSNNVAEKMIILKGEEPYSNSSIKIQEVYLGSDNKAKFGEVIKIKVDIYKGDTNKNSVKIWLENNEGKKASKTINSNFYSKFANYTLIIPIQIDPNCDGKLPNGKYSIKVEGLDEYDKKEILIEGISSYSCKTKTLETSCSCGPYPKHVSEEETEEESEEFGIISCPEEISKGGEIEIKINLENPSANRKNYTIYSYVYEGNKPVSLGFDGNDWVNRWNANSQNVTISGNSSLNLTLKNRIAGDTNPGKYKLRVRIWVDDKKHDITRDILIKEPAEPANQTINQTVEEENKTEYNETESDEPESEIHTPTGRVISKDENWFSILIESVINFFKNLFSL